MKNILKIITIALAANFTDLILFAEEVKDPLTEKYLTNLVLTGKNDEVGKILGDLGASGQAISILKNMPNSKEKISIVKMLLSESDDYWGQSKRFGSGVRSMVLTDFCDNTLKDYFPSLKIDRNLYQNELNRQILLKNIENIPQTGGTEQRLPDPSNRVEAPTNFGVNSVNDPERKQNPFVINEKKRLLWIIGGVLLVLISFFLCKILKLKSA